MSWTPGRNGALPFVRAMHAYGFDWIWLDGDRGAAFHGYFSAREGHSARFVDPFEARRPFPVRSHPARRSARARPGRQAGAGAPPGGHAGVRRDAAAGGRARATWRARQPSRSPASPPRVPARGRRRRERRSGCPGKAATIPATGILVSGESLGGVRLGDRRSDVRRLWGHKFIVCEGCEPTTWFYWYPSGESGLGVEFRHGQVTGVYTLGRTVGWRSTDGLKIGGYMSNKELQEKSVWKNCPATAPSSRRRATRSRRCSSSDPWSTGSR